MYIWAIYAQFKPLTNIYGFYIYVYSLHLAIFIHYALCIYHFGMFQRCYPTSARDNLQKYTQYSMGNFSGYITAFYCATSRVVGITDDEMLDRFIAGLKPKIHRYCL